MITLDHRFTSDPLRSRFPFGRKTQLRRRYDWDAQMYFNRVQAAGTELSVDERSNISSFIRGLKALGAWDSLVDGWTLRSSQNVGTGSTVPGLKSITGTLVNGPTWGVSGISFTGAGRYLSTTAPGFPVAPGSLLVVGSISWATVFTNACLLGCIVVGARGWGVVGASGVADQGLASFLNNVGTVNYTVSDTTVPTNAVGVWQHHQQTGNTGKARIDGTEYPTISFKNWDTDGFPGTLIPVYNIGPGTSQIAFVGFFTMDTRPIAEQLRSLIKDTIGKGMGLP